MKKGNLGLISFAVYAMLEGRTQPTGAYILYYIYYFRTIFLLINYSIRDHHFIHPNFFIFATPIHDPRFATPIRDPHFAIHISRLTFATHVLPPTFCDSTHDSHSRPAFATLLATHIHDLHSRLHSRLMLATPDHSPQRDSLFFVATSVVQLHH